MPRKLINLGSGYDTSDGDKLRDGGGFINENFKELYSRATTWSPQTYNDRTTVIVSQSLYILSEFAGIPFNSADFTAELSSGLWIKIDGSSGGSGLPNGGTKDQVIAKNSSVDGDVSWVNTFMRFKGDWVNASYKKEDMVYSSPYIGIALNDTSDIFPPQLDGLPSWALPDTPTWDTQTVLGDVATGVDFIVPYLFGVESIRFWVNTQIGIGYTLVVYELIDSKFVLTASEEYPAGSSGGWYVLSDISSRVYTTGERVRIVKVNHDATNDVATMTEYKWRINDTNTGSGEATSIGGNIIFSNTDDNGVDRTSLLASIKENDVIEVWEAGSSDRFITYKATGVGTDDTSSHSVPVIVTSSGKDIRDGRNTDINIIISTATNTDYVRIVDGNLGNPNGVKGFVTQSASDLTDPNLVLDNNQYGLDIEIQKYTTSNNWFYINIGSGGSSNGSTLPGVEIVDDLVTQDATKALSANQGYALDQNKVGETDNNAFTNDNLFSGGELKYDDPNASVGDPWIPNEVANKDYLYKYYQPIGEADTVGEAIPANSIVYQGSDFKWYLANASVIAEVSNRLRFIKSSALINQEIDMFDKTQVTLTGLTPGNVIYLSENGMFTSTLPTGNTYVRIVGYAITTTFAIFELRSNVFVKTDGSEVNNVKLKVSNVYWIEIDDAMVFKGVNTGATIEVGDIIKRHPAANRYINARVNTLPYTDDNNLSFFEDIQII